LFMPMTLPDAQRTSRKAASWKERKAATLRKHLREEGVSVLAEALADGAKAPWTSSEADHWRCVAHAQRLTAPQRDIVKQAAGSIVAAAGRNLHNGSKQARGGFIEAKDKCDAHQTPRRMIGHIVHMADQSDQDQAELAPHHLAHNDSSSAIKGLSQRWPWSGSGVKAACSIGSSRSCLVQEHGVGDHSQSFDGLEALALSTTVDSNASELPEHPGAISSVRKPGCLYNASAAAPPAQAAAPATVHSTCGSFAAAPRHSPPLLSLWTSDAQARRPGAAIETPARSWGGCSSSSCASPPVEGMHPCEPSVDLAQGSRDPPLDIETASSSRKDCLGTAATTGSCSYPSSRPEQAFSDIRNRPRQPVVETLSDLNAQFNVLTADLTRHLEQARRRLEAKASYQDSYPIVEPIACQLPRPVATAPASLRAVQSLPARALVGFHPHSP